MSLADELRGNYNPPEERYYFKEIKYIVRTIINCAKEKSVSSHNLSGYYSYGGYEESEGIYERASNSAAYYHIEDFGSYKEGILSYGYIKDEEIITVKNVERALKEIKEILVRDGFKNVIVEERYVTEVPIAYGEEKMLLRERLREQRKTYMKLRHGTKKLVYVNMPVYNLYISINW